MYHEDRGPSGRMVGRSEVLEEHPELAEHWDAVDGLFPVRITRSFWERGGDEIRRQVLPDARELEAGPDDPVGELGRSPVPWVVHKYPRRALLLLTKRCHLYCRYCFRRTHAPEEAQDPSPEAWEAAMAYVLSRNLSEVILSGGDPLAVRDARLFDTLDRLASIPVRRIHTRAPITAPHRVTDALVEGLRARAPLWVVVHANHPRELSPEVDQALARLVDAGVPVLNQSVLLRGVNDDAGVLAALCEKLVERRVFPYYLHHTDAVQGNRHFRVTFEQGRDIYAELKRLVSGVALPRYVIDPPSGEGKQDVTGPWQYVNSSD